MRLRRAAAELVPRVQDTLEERSSLGEDDAEHEHEGTQGHKHARGQEQVPIGDEEHEEADADPNRPLRDSVVSSTTERR